MPDLAPLAAPQTTEERRMRQRLHVKRTYYRKLIEMQTLRTSVQQLEEKFAQMQKLKHERETNRQGVSAADEAALLNSQVDTDSSTARSPKDLYEDVIAAKAQLRLENEALQRAVAEHNRFALKASSYMRLSGIVVPLEEQPVEDKIGTEPFTPVDAPALRHSIDSSTCQELARHTFEGIRQFTASLSFVSSGVSLFGWRDKRIRSGDRVAFSLTKIFHEISALELSMRGWAVTGASNGLSRLYSSSMNVVVTSLQQVDDDNQIKLRVMASQDGRLLVKTLFLVSRFALPKGSGYVIVIRSLDHNKYLAASRPPSIPRVKEQWVDYHNWTIFESHGESGEHCRLEFGGQVQSNSVAGSDTWMLEVLLVALRWENIVIGPVITIC